MRRTARDRDSICSKSFIVYCIYCRSNQKSYIGITSNYEARLAVHWDDSKWRDTILCRTIRKYGKENFSIFKIDWGNTWQEVCELEKKYIKDFCTRAPLGMNMTDGGDGTYGLIMSEETRKKMSKTHTGMHEGCLNHMYGKPGPMLGRKRSEESNKKLSISCKGRIPWNKGKKCPQLAGESNGFYHGKFSEEVLRKISRLGFKHSEETRKQMTLDRIGLQAGEKHSQCKLTEAKVRRIREFFSVGISKTELAKMFDVTLSNIYCIVNRISWAHVR